uniref:Uncharacterized protein n=1 Tax=Solanum lycopersicum TaxID=4081 RepID=A0A3Q7FQ59_SOLLC
MGTQHPKICVICILGIYQSLKIFYVKVFRDTIYLLEKYIIPIKFKNLKISLQK